MKTLNPARCIVVCRNHLRAELSAFDFYTAALQEYPDDPERALVLSIRSYHDESIDSLMDHLREMGATVPENVRASAQFDQAVEGAAAVFGERAELLALEAGEASLLAEYRRALEEPQVLDHLKQDIRRALMPRIEGHIAALELARSA